MKESKFGGGDFVSLSFPSNEESSRKRKMSRHRAVREPRSIAKHTAISILHSQRETLPFTTSNYTMSEEEKPTETKKAEEEKAKEEESTAHFEPVVSFLARVFARICRYRTSRRRSHPVGLPMSMIVNVVTDLMG